MAALTEAAEAAGDHGGGARVGVHDIAVENHDQPREGGDGRADPGVGGVRAEAALRTRADRRGEAVGCIDPTAAAS